jgi:asparagine synthetase B (glutamine-hydrolysing)
MLKGVLGNVDLGPADGFEEVRRGPLTVVYDPAGAACADVDGVTCVFHGYLYDGAGNPAELIADAYRRSGEEILQTLRGRYSVVLWDNRSERGVVACDLLAMEALYYSRTAGRVAFAGEFKDLFSLLPATPGPDPRAVTGWLTGGLPVAGMTPFEGVGRLTPGRLIELRPGGSDTRRYWRPTYRGTMRGTRDELADGLRAELDRSVRRRLAQRAPAVVLSGGLDSSIVAAISSRERPRGMPLRTYSAVFPGAEYDEAWKVKRLTDALDVEPVAFTVEPRGALWLALNHARRWDMPLMGAGAVHESFAVTEAAKDGAEVVLDGQTGDETLGFAPYYLSDLLRRGRMLAALRLIERWPVGRAPTRSETRWVLKNVGVKGAVPYWLGEATRKLRGRDAAGVPEWLAPAQQRGLVQQRDEWAWKVGSSGPRWWRFLSDFVIDGPHRELRPDYLRQRAAAAGVLNESPLYDFDVIDYCLRLPPGLAFAREHTRPLARHALRDLIPDDVRLNSQKAVLSDFCFQMISVGDALGIQRLLDAPDAEIGAYVDMDWVRRLWHHDRPQPGQSTGYWGTAIWLLVAVECWLRAQSDPEFVDRMLAGDDVLPPAMHRVPLDRTGTFFSLAGT